MSDPRFACEWDDSKQVSSCYLMYCNDKECYLACPSCPDHDINLVKPTHVSYKLYVNYGLKILAHADIKNDGSDGNVTLEVYDKTNGRVLGVLTKDVPSGWTESFDVFFTAESDAEVWFHAKDDSGNVKDKYGPIFVHIIHPTFYKPNINCMISAVKDGKVVAVAMPGKSATATSDCVFYGLADVINNTPSKQRCALQVWDWERNKGYAWHEFYVDPNEKRTVKTNGFTLKEGFYKFTLILWVMENGKWVASDATDTMRLEVKPAPTKPTNPNPKFETVCYTINGETYYPPFSKEVDKGAVIEVKAKIKNYGASGECYFKLWDGYNSEYVISETKYVENNESATFLKSISVDKSLYLVACTGFDNVITDKSPAAKINVKGEQPPPTPPTPPTQPTTPTPPTIPTEIYGIPTWMLVGGGIVVLIGLWAYYEEKKREELMMMLAMG